MKRYNPHVLLAFLIAIVGTLLLSAEEDEFAPVPVTATPENCVRVGTCSNDPNVPCKTSDGKQLYEIHSVVCGIPAKGTFSPD